MKVLGITGGVGAGKSTVLMYLKEHYGARVIQADQVGHLLQQPHESCYRRIVELFGTTVLNADGTISRPKLGAIVYADPQENGAVECNYASIYPALDQVGGRGRTKTGVCAIRDRRSGTSPGGSL